MHTINNANIIDGLTMELYLVGVHTASGKHELRQVWIDTPTGIALQQKEDFKQAISIVEAEGNNTTGEVYTAKSLIPVLESAKEAMLDHSEHVSRLFEKYESPSSLASYMSSNERVCKVSRTEQNFEEISINVEKYVNKVLPVNSKLSFAADLGVSVPTLYRLLAAVDISHKRGVHWPLMAKVFEELGVLSEIAALVDRRVDSLVSSKVKYLADKGINEPVNKSGVY